MKPGPLQSGLVKEYENLPILRCRERIETTLIPKGILMKSISLYFGVGSGLKRVNNVSTLYICEISLYFGVGSGLKRHTKLKYAMESISPYTSV